MLSYPPPRPVRLCARRARVARSSPVRSLLYGALERLCGWLVERVDIPFLASAPGDLLDIVPTHSLASNMCITFSGGSKHKIGNIYRRLD
eukprot:6739951-Prymnesium_polylepis.1